MIPNNKTTSTHKVYAIENGTAIDHITAGHALTIIHFLNLADEGRVVTVGLNFQSKKLKYKDVIKVENKELTPEEISRIAIFAPEATINIIKNHKITKKFKARIPAIIEYVITCPNPKCITNHEGVCTKFHVNYQNNVMNLKCHYCEKVFTEKELPQYKNI